MTEFKKDTIAVVVIKRNTIPLSKNRQLAQKIDKNTGVDQKRGVAEVE